MKATAATPAIAIPTNPLLPAEMPLIAAPLGVALAEPVALPPPVMVVVGEFDLLAPLADAMPLADPELEPADGPCKKEVSAVAVEKMLM